jgi:hypothetical protein
MSARLSVSGALREIPHLRTCCCPRLTRRLWLRHHAGTDAHELDAVLLLPFNVLNASLKRRVTPTLTSRLGASLLWTGAATENQNRHNNDQSSHGTLPCSTRLAPGGSYAQTRKHAPRIPSGAGSDPTPKNEVLYSVGHPTERGPVFERICASRLVTTPDATPITLTVYSMGVERRSCGLLHRPLPVSAEIHRGRGYHRRR